MAIKTASISVAVAFFGILALIFGVIAEHKKPKIGHAIMGRGIVICTFPTDPSVALGSSSVVALVLSTVLGLFSVFYSYEGKSVPKKVLFQSTTFLVFFGIAVGVSVFGGAMMLWATITESLHHIHNVHHRLDYKCPTAKTGLFGGAAFLALDASLFWLICQMLALNAREDYLDDPKGDYGQVLATDFGQVLATDYNENARARV